MTRKGAKGMSNMFTPLGSKVTHKFKCPIAPKDKKMVGNYQK